VCEGGGGRVRVGTMQRVVASISARTNTGMHQVMGVTPGCPTGLSFGSGKQRELGWLLDGPETRSRR
jgi:hypothetical protein